MTHITCRLPAKNHSATEPPYAIVIIIIIILYYAIYGSTQAHKHEQLKYID